MSPTPVNNNFAKGNDGGAPLGNQNAVGNSGGGAPQGNQNAAKHHLHADPANVLDWLKTHDPEAYDWIQAKIAGYLKDAPFDAGTPEADQLTQVAVGEYAIWKAMGIQIREGVLTKTHIQGFRW